MFRRADADNSPRTIDGSAIQPTALRRRLNALPDGSLKPSANSSTVGGACGAARERAHDASVLTLSEFQKLFGPVARSCAGRSIDAFWTRTEAGPPRRWRSRRKMLRRPRLPPRAQFFIAGAEEVHPRVAPPAIGYGDLEE